MEPMTMAILGASALVGFLIIKKVARMFGGGQLQTAGGPQIKNDFSKLSKDQKMNRQLEKAAKNEKNIDKKEGLLNKLRGGLRKEDKDVAQTQQDIVNQAKQK